MPDFPAADETAPVLAALVAQDRAITHLVALSAGADAPLPEVARIAGGIPTTGRGDIPTTGRGDIERGDIERGDMAPRRDCIGCLAGLACPGEAGSGWSEAVAAADSLPAGSLILLAAPRSASGDGAAAALMAFAARGWMPEGRDRTDGDGTLATFRLERRDIAIRLAVLADLPALDRLEQECWAPDLRMPAERLAHRIDTFPDGQLVLECGGAVVGAVFSQRVAAATFEGRTASDVHALHRPDGPILQLLALNIAPAVQDRGFGDRLLDFALERAAVLPDIAQVVGVTRCKDAHRHPDLDPAAYAALRNASGRRVDPVLRMHELHGAEIVGPVEGYRPADTVNGGAGVLVRYDPRRRRRHEVEMSAPPSADPPADVLGTVRAAIAEVLGWDDPGRVPLSAPLFELGLDSADLLDLNERLRLAFGLVIEPAFFFEHGTCARIAAQLGRTGDGATPAAASATARRGGSETDDIAIVGLACRLPGGIATPDAFWRQLAEGRSSIGRLPADRRSWPAGFDPDAHPGIAQGGFLDDIARFDAAFFRISPKEAAIMDPQQRLVLEAAWAVLEDAGWPPSELAGSDTGVFVGASGSDYRLRLCEAPQAEIGGHFALGSSMAVLANRISYVFDFHGPSLQIDTACSSSLVALHEAVTAMRTGACRQALVAGVNLLCHPATSIAYYRAGMLSKDGRCKTFDASADGYVRGEGVIALLLKPLSRALADNDRVEAVIKGTAVNHGGQAAGLTVPDPARQAALVRSALAAGGIPPDTVTYVEAHGTGTALGDPVELHGLRQAFGEGRTAPPCLIGSVKTNIGHLEAAAGLAGLLKVVLSLRSGTIPASLHYAERNPHLSFDGTPFAVASGATPWMPAPGSPRRAGVSSFGSGGANAHAVVEEASARPPGAVDPGPFLVPLSARDEGGLRARAADLAAWLAEAPAPRIGDVAYTLQIGRDAFAHRAAFVVDDLSALRTALAGLAAGEVGAAEDAAGTPAARLHALARLWCAGGTVDWSELWAGRDPRRLRLPTYPFHGERHWAFDGAGPAIIGQTGPAAGLAARVRGHVAAVLAMPVEDLPETADLRAYGLDSIGGLALRQRIEEDFGIALSGLDILDHADLAALAAHVAAQLPDGVPGTHRRDAMTASAAGRRPSEAQMGLWAFQAAHPDSHAYNLPFLLRFEGRLDPDRLDAALRLAIALHPVLCERMVETAEGLRRLRDAAISVQREEGRHLDEAALSARLGALAAEPFRLDETGPLRVHVMERGEATLLLVVIHHIAFDGGSVGPFFSTLLDRYLDGAAGDAIPRDYDLFVDAEAATIGGAAGDRARQHFAARLAGAPGLLDLPVDGPHRIEPPSGAPRPAAVAVTRSLAGTEADRFTAFCRAERITPVSLLLAAFGVVLGRWTGVGDLVVGVAASMRRRPELRDLVGFCVNMVPVRLVLDEDPAWTDTLRAVQRALVEDLDYTTYPLAALVRDLRRERPADATPLFQVVLNYQADLNEACRTLEARYAGRLPFRFLPDLHQGSEYALALDVAETRDRYDLRLTCDAGRFEAATAERLLDHLCTLIESGIAQPSAPQGALAMLTADERQRILGPWAGPGANGTATTVDRLVAAQAARTPEAVAVSQHDAHLTYRQLVAAAGALAQRLAAAGLQPGDRVGVILRRSPALPVALLGVLAAGAAYVPLDPDLPDARLRFMAEDAGLRLAVTEAGLRDRAATLLPGTVGILGVDETADEARPAAGLPDHGSPDGLAYVLYTSGSTGRPKGVMVRHSAFASALLALARVPGLGPGERLLAVTTYGFDIAGFELLGPLVVGGTCVLCPSDAIQDPGRLRAVVEAARPALIQATPSLWGLLFESGWRPRPGMRLLCGGEPLPDGLRRLFEACDGEAWNMYGPTEATIWATAQRIAPGEPHGVGRPLGNSRVYLLDRALRPVPVGVTGEVCIGGQAVADGYLGRPDLTEARFMPDPFVPGDRLYLTGDRARWLADGSIDLLGRSDDQVKIRGHRIELGDVEANLAAHPGVRDAIAVVETADDHPRLVVHYRPAQGVPASEAALRAHMTARLPAVMVPARFVSCAAFPLTPNGKIDRAALAAGSRTEPGGGPREGLGSWQHEGDEGARSGRRIGDDLERRIAAIWREALRRPEIGRDDGFFEFGGDSVLAVVVARRIAQAAGVPFGVTDLFRHPTIAAVTGHLAAPPDDPSCDVREPDCEAPRGAAGAPGIAIVGMSGTFPGAEGIAAFWDNLIAGIDAIRRPSTEELRAAGAPEAIIEDSRFVAAQATIAGKALFDAAFFRVAPRDAERMHPQMRLLLTHAWKAVEDAGYAVRDIPGTAVYMTASSTAYGDPDRDGPSGPDEPRVLGAFGPYQPWLLGQPGTIPTLVSHRLGFTGPSCFVHANCSSSLVALDLACRALERGEVRQALVGAASLLTGWSSGYVHQDGLNFAADGRVKAFDAAADGMVGGEGVVVVVLKRLDDAVADGDTIRAVIRGIAVTNDGAEKAGFYAPGVKGQAAAISGALAAAGIEPASIRYVEAHGTGTALGDPIEVAALAEAFGARDDGARPHCGLGSVKSNIGHLDAAAGLAGLVKAALALDHGVVPPTLHVRSANPRAGLDGSPFFVVTEAMALPEGRDVHVAVSSFGIGGTNAHAILGRAPARTGIVRPAGEPEIVLLSARDEAALARRAQDLLQVLTGGGDDLADLAFTLAVGREPMEARLALVARSRSELEERLRRWLAGERPLEGVEAGRVEGAGLGLVPVVASDPDFADTVERWLRRRRLTQLAAIWVRGHAVDWPVLWQGRGMRRLPLPTYPFAPEPFWIRPAPRPGAAEPLRLHPLVHQNTSTLRGQRFTATFSGRERVLADHRFHGVPVLPGVAHLEMARVAAALSLELGETEIAVTDAIWLRPLEVAGGRTVAIEIEAESDEALAWQIRPVEGAAEAPPFSRGRAVRVVGAEAPVLSPDALRAACSRTIGAEACYRWFAALGFDYGRAMQALGGLSAGQDGDGTPFVLADAAMPDGLGDDALVLHPSMLDAALQARIGLDPDLIGRSEPPAPSMPFAVEEVRIYGHAPERGVIWVRPSAGSRTGAGALDIDLADPGGRVRVALRGFSSRPVVAGEGVVLARPGWHPGAPAPGIARPDRRLVVLCGDRPRARAAASVLARTAPEAGCVLLGDASAGGGRAFREATAELLIELKALAAEPGDGPFRIQVAVFGDEAQVGFEGLQGLLSTARMEDPRLSGQVIRFVDPIGADIAVAALSEEASAPSGDAPIRYRAGGRETLRWEEMPVAGSVGAPWRDGGVYLLTGGHGGLGLMFAEDIVRRATRPTIVLVSRTGPRPADGPRFAALKAGGARVAHRTADVSDAAAVHRLVAEATAEFGRLSGVLHVAGALADGLIVRKSVLSLEAVLRPKTDGVDALDAATADEPLDFFALFASTSGTFGNVGQGDYAAANAFLDAFADQRSTLVAAGRRSGRTVAIDWPLWAEGGMTMNPTAERSRRALGHAPLPTEAGLRAFEAALASGERRVLVLHGQVARLRGDLFGPSTATAAPVLVEAEPAPAPPVVPGTPRPARPGQDDRHRLAEHLKRLMAPVVGLPAARMDTEADFERYGIDSVMAVDLVAALEADFGPLPKTLLFEYRSVLALTDHIAARYRDRLPALLGTPSGSGAGRPAPAAPVAPASRPAAERPTRFRRPTGAEHPSPRSDVAIIGLAGRYPGARNVDAFWRNLCNGVDAITEIPSNRWDHSRYFTPDKSDRSKTCSKWGGFIDGVDECDPLFFNISPREMELIDPQERLFLQCAYEAVEDAGYARRMLARRPGESAEVGVYVGVMYAEYQLFGAQAQGRGDSLTLTGSPASIANRVSHFFDFTGPSLAVDTMCSSSLTAIHLACRDLGEGCDYALAGGVNVSVHPNKYLFLGQRGFVSSQGRCQSFGEGGDGYVPGEGVGAVLLKRLSRAEADGDRIYGVIRGTAVNHGGRTNGYTVPNPQAQARAVETALRAAGVTARDISYVEAHGTGTALGDPIEIAGLTRAFAAFTPETGFCAIGSAKSNIGHCESAAGIAGLTKVLLQIKHGTLAPSLHAATLNPHIDFAATPFVVQQERALAAADRGGRARAAAPGRALLVRGRGANAHLVIEEYLQAPGRREAAAGAQILVLSARTPDQLRRRAEDLAAALGGGELAEASLADLAFTLQVGRDAHERRLAVVAETVAEFGSQLSAWLAGGAAAASGEGVWTGEAGDGVPALLDAADLAGVVEGWLSRGAYDRLAEAWCRGIAIDWLRLHPGPRRRIRLPTYPFERQRYWIEAEPAARAPMRRAAAPVSPGPAEPGPFSRRDSDPTGSPDANDRRLYETRPAGEIVALAAPPLPDAILTAFRSTAAAVLKLAPEQLAAETELVAYGFDSITFAQLANRLNEAHDLGLSASDFFVERTLGGVVARLFRTAPTRVAAAFAPAEGAAMSGAAAEAPADSVKTIPLSAAQHRLWLLGQVEDLGAAYHIPTVIRLRGEVDAEALRRAVDALVARHEALRTRIVPDGAGAVQVVDPPGAAPFRIEKATGGTPEEREASAMQRTRRLIAGPFDLSAGPLLRCVLIRLNDGEALLVLVLHHIVSDGWSMDLIREELGAIYAAECDGRPVDLGPPVQRAVDPAPGSAAGDLAHWRAELAGLPHESTFPPEHPRPARRSHRGESLAFTWPPSLLAGLRGLGQETGTTLFMVLAAGLHALIGRLSGQEDVVIGTAVAGRRTRAQERVVGLFAETVPLRADLSGEPTFLDLVRRVRGVAERAYSHQDVGFERLVEALNPDRDLTRHPLFQVMLTLRRQGTTGPVPFGPAATAEAVEPDIGATPFDATLHLLEGSDTITGRLEYALDLYGQDTAIRLVDGLRTLLEAAAAAPGTLVADLPVMTEAERARLFEALSGPVRPLGGVDPVHLRIQARAALAPDAPAVLSGGACLSYAELDARSDRLAAALRALGVARNRIVGVCLDRSPDAVVTLLAVLKAGGAYLPLDPSYPAARLNEMFVDSGAAVLVTRSTLRGVVASGSAVLLLVDDPTPADLPDVPDVPAGAEDLAYLLYTSGSTGRPKGVMIPHRALSNVLAAMAERVPLAAGDVMAAVTPLSFDIAGLELWLPLVSGATVAIADRTIAESGPALAAFLVDVHATVLQATPATWRMLVEAGWQPRPGLTALCGGEALPLDLAQALTAGGGTAWNLYGPTETTIWSTALRLTPGWQGRSVGRPLDNTRLSVLDRRGRPLPALAPGELAIAGAGLALGYLGRDDLTAERFPPDPFGPPGARLYRTGDLACASADGEIAFLGRLDHQVKIRGHRIELGEIEAVLRDDPEVRQAVVVARDIGPGDRRLAAYVVPDRNPAEPGRDGVATDTQYAVWEEIYRDAGDAPVPGFTGWTAVSRGEALPEAEQEIWLGELCARIAALRPTRLLDIGCGPGFVLSRVAPAVDVYCGTDRSPAAVARLARWMRRTPGFGHVRLACREASAYWDAEEGAFDLVVLNAVIQCFADAPHLDAVLARAIAMAPAGGAIFIGDVRPRSLLAVESRAAAMAHAADGDTAGDIRVRAVEAEASDPDLRVDPGFFFALALRHPRLPAVEIRLKEAATDNALTRYRYDVVLRIESGRCERPDGVIERTGAMPADEIEDILRSREAPAIILRSAPNARLTRDLAWVSALEAADEETTIAALTRAVEPTGVDPAAAAVLAERHGYRFAAAWSAGEPAGSIDCAFYDPDRVAPPALALGRPINSRAAEDDADADRSAPGIALTVRLRDRLRGTLPAHVVPPTITVLPHLPQTPNGKIDRSALAAREAGLPDRGNPVLQRPAPSGPIATQLASIWSEVLGVADIGADDDFFALGGHSLLAMRAVVGARDALGIDVSMRDLFEAPTVASLAARLEPRARRGESRPAGWAAPLPHPRSVPLRFGSGHPLFLFHAIGGGVGLYDPLVQSLRRAWPVHGLNGLRDEAPGRIDELARDYAAEILSLCPDGAAHLLGWSFGGVVAFETARCLTSRGRPPLSVTLVDACLPARPWSDGPEDADAIWSAFCSVLASEEAGTVAHGCACPPHRDFAALAARHPGLGIEGLMALYPVFVRNMQAWSSYRPESANLPLTVIHAADRSDAEAAGRRFVDWSALGGASPAVTLPGDHVSLMRPPHVAMVAAVVEGRSFAVRSAV